MAKKKTTALRDKYIKILIARKYQIIEILSLMSLFIFSALVFNYIKNWDMIVRILNARHMFFNSYYYEPMRALFESFVIGLFSFISQPYAIYFFIFFVSAVFFIAIVINLAAEV